MRALWWRQRIGQMLVGTALHESVAPFSGRTMNGVPPFDSVHPTAERLAEDAKIVGLAATVENMFGRVLAVGRERGGK